MSGHTHRRALQKPLEDYRLSITTKPITERGTVNSMWSFRHYVEGPVSKDFAWQFWTNVDNWARVDSSIEWARLEGPFTKGTAGTTGPRGSEPTRWLIADVEDGRSATIEIAAPGAILRCAWVFEETDSGGTRITQEASLEGERAEQYLEAVKGLEEGIPAGMQKLMKGMERSSAGSDA